MPEHEHDHNIFEGHWMSEDGDFDMYSCSCGDMIEVR